MKWWVLIIRVSKGKASNNNILCYDIWNNTGDLEDEKSGIQACDNFEKNEL